jgi:TM2 domain-containing membrane protein YozV
MADENNKEEFDSNKSSFNEEAKSASSEFKEGWNQATNNGENKKLLAGLLGIFVGALGVHKFILGYNKEGIILLSATLISCVLMCVIIGFFTIYIPALIGLIEGIIYLTKSDEEFYNTYQVGKKPWF